MDIDEGVRDDISEFESEDDTSSVQVCYTHSYPMLLGASDILTKPISTSIDARTSTSITVPMSASTSSSIQVVVTPSASAGPAVSPPALTSHSNSPIPGPSWSQHVETD